MSADPRAQAASAALPRGRGALDDIDSVILAGGLGTRLAEALPGRQKVLAPVAGKPFLARLIDLVRSAGGRRIIVALGHKAGQVTDWLAAGAWGDLEIAPSVEPAALGTGGALRFAFDSDSLRSDDVLVLNGDSFADADLGALVAFHRARRAAVSLLLVPVAEAARYGTVETAADGSVTAFREKDPAAAAPAYVNAGVYLFRREVIGNIPAGRPVSLENEVFTRYCAAGLFAQRQDVPFIDIGTPESWRTAGRFFANLDNPGGRE